MEVVKADVSDMPSINELYRQCGNDMILKFGLNHWDQVYPQDLLQRRIEDGLVYKAISDNEMIASFMLEKEYPQPFIDAKKADDTPFRYLTRLAVFPEFQSKGIGSDVLGHAELIARKQGAYVMRLDILKGHKTLEKFYKKNGYKKIGKGKTRRFKIVFFEKEI